MNSILPLMVSIGSLSEIKFPTRVLQKSGTYQSNGMSPDEFLDDLIISFVQIHCGIPGWTFCVLSHRCYQACALLLLWVVGPLSMSSILYALGFSHGPGLNAYIVLCCHPFVVSVVFTEMLRSCKNFLSF